MARTTVRVDGRELSLSNLDKVLYPAAGTTKAAVLDYYTRIAPVLLPHLRGRPLTMKRYPDGVDAEMFYAKRLPDHAPDWVRSVTLGRVGKEKVVDHVDVTDLGALVWVANLAALELHTSLGRAPDPFTPTCAVFDLDPGAPATIVECCQVALHLRTVFDQLGLRALAKTSGSKGLQVYVPVNRPTTYEVTRAFALAMGELVARVHPDLVVTNMSKDLRTGRVLVDWSQNHLTKTTVSVYSLRAMATPTVSTPVTWAEVADGATGEASLVFGPDDVLRRVERDGDLFADVETVRQDLPRLG